MLGFFKPSFNGVRSIELNILLHTMYNFTSSEKKKTNKQKIYVTLSHIKNSFCFFKTVMNFFCLWFREISAYKSKITIERTNFCSYMARSRGFYIISIHMSKVIAILSTICVCIQGMERIQLTKKLFIMTIPDQSK